MKHERQTAANDCCDWMKGVNLPTKSLHGSSCDLNERDLFWESPAEMTAVTVPHTTAAGQQQDWFIWTKQTQQTKP